MVRRTWAAGAAATAMAVVALCASAQAAIVHKFEPGPTAQISKEASACTGPGSVTGPLEWLGAGMLTVDEGALWVADAREGAASAGEGARVDEFNASTGACLGQLKYPSANEKLYRGGIAIGHSTGEREAYVGLSEYASTRGVVAVFGPSGAVQHVWTGANTPDGSFAHSSPGQHAEINGVAADEDHSLSDWASGDVIVATERGLVDVFKPTAGGAEPPPENVWQLRGTCGTVGTVCSGAGVVAFANPHAVAVDQETGELFVVDVRENEATHILEASIDMFMPVGLAGEYQYEGRLTPAEGASAITGQVTGLAVDGGEVYLSRFTPTGEAVVEQFSIAEDKRVGRMSGTNSEPFAHAEAVAIDPVTHRVYVADHHSQEIEGSASAIDVFGPGLVVPDVTTSNASAVTASTAVLHGTVDPQNAGEATCEFEYGVGGDFGGIAECAHSVPNGNAAIAVSSQEVTGLRPGTTYRYRLAAANGNGRNAGTCPEDCGEFVTKGPGIGEVSADHVTSTSARLHAVIDPNGAATSYFFQYGREGAPFEGHIPAGPGTALGAGNEALQVPAVDIGGLAPETRYRYRVVAVSEVEVSPGTVESHEFTGPDEAFTTQGRAVTGLPDGRQWEMVSPTIKKGALIEPINSIFGSNGDVIQAAAAGGAIAYVADTPTEAEPLGADNGTELISTREVAGWRTRNLTVPHVGPTDGSLGPGNEYRLFSADLSMAIVEPFGAFDPSISEEASEPTAFLHRSFEGDGAPCDSHCYRPLTTGCPSPEEEAKGRPCPPAVRASANVPAGTKFGEFGNKNGQLPFQEAGERCPPMLTCGPQFVGASTNAEHVVLSSSVALTAQAIPNELHAASLYEWNYTPGAAASGSLALLSILPEAEGGAPAGDAALGKTNVNARNAISSDGAHVFFSFSSGKLYMRDVATAKTIRLDLPEAGCEGCGLGPANAVFEDASSDGTRALFTDTQRLTANAGARGVKPDLYECRIVADACQISDLTPKAADGASAWVQGDIPGASEDGEWVYFVADGALENSGTPVPGAVHGDCEGERTLNEAFASKEGQAAAASRSCNLYAVHDGVTSLVAVISGADLPDARPVDLSRMTSRVSPNGKWLAFMSERGLTGYNTTDARSGQPDEEVYIYDAAAAELHCASCDPTGARPIGAEYAPASGPTGRAPVAIVGGTDIWPQSQWLAALLPGWTRYHLTTARYQSRYLSNDGRLFFNGRDPVTPQAINENWNVYEWEPSGVRAGSESACSNATPGYDAATKGCIALISSGESSDESGFLDASESGGDVFFMTTSKLSPSDTDNSYDVYDAHECTSLAPCQPAPPPPAAPCASSDSCRSAPSSPPGVFGPPASALFSGSGNVNTTLRPGATAQTRQQMLAKAVAACRKKSPSSRRSCEARARAKYGTTKQKLAAALQMCRKGHRTKSERVLCERRARKRYASRSAKNARRTGGDS